MSCSIGQDNTRNLPFDTKPEVLLLSHLGINYVKILAKDIPGSYDTISGSGFFQCFDFFGTKQILTHFASDLILDETSKVWSSKPVQVPYCTVTLFEYSVNAFKQDSSPTSYSFNGIKNISDKILNSQNKTANINLEKRFSNNNESQTDSNLNKLCEYSKTIINFNQNVCKGKLIFEDDFNEMNLSKWNRDIIIPSDAEDDDFVSFQNFEQNLYIKDSVLYILPKLLTDLTNLNIRNGTLNLEPSCTGIVDRSLECYVTALRNKILPPIVSARIKTKDIFSFKYGIIEIRAKLPKGDWLFPQLYLQPSSNYYGMSNYSSGQIRVAFIRSNEMLYSKNGTQIDGYRLYGGVVLVQGEQLRENWMKNTLSKRLHYGNQFHNYKTTWTDEFISFEVDGQEYGRLNGNFGYEAYNKNGIQHAESWKINSKMAPFDKEFFLSLGVSVGGISDFPDHSTSGTRNSDKKPWENFDPKNKLNFWKAQHHWYSTWLGENAALKVDFIRVWAL